MCHEKWGQYHSLADVLVHALYTMIRNMKKERFHAYYHDIILSLLPLVVYSWYAMNSTKSVVHLPLVGGTIVATFAGSMFKFYCNLQSICTRCPVTNTRSGNTATNIYLPKSSLSKLSIKSVGRRIANLNRLGERRGAAVVARGGASPVDAPDDAVTVVHPLADGTSPCRGPYSSGGGGRSFRRPLLSLRRVLPRERPGHCTVRGRLREVEVAAAVDWSATGRR